MSRIRGRDTGPERALRRALWGLGLRHRLQVRLEGCRPDLVFRAARVAVFVDGCFWHGCPDHYVAPRTPGRFWADKLRRNVERDRKSTAALERAGWRAIRLWEHEVEADAVAAASKVAAAVRAALGSKPFRPKPSMRVLEVRPLDAKGSLESRQLVPLRGERCEFEVRSRKTGKWKRAQAFAGRRRGAKNRVRKSGRSR